MPAPVLVLGGGISGLTAALRLQRSGQEVRVLESEARSGGLIESEHVEGYLLEWGPHSIIPSQELFFELAESLGHEAEVLRADRRARDRYIYRGGRLRRVPSGPRSFVTSRLLSGRGKLRLLGEPFVRRGSGDESVAEFFERRFGREVVEYLVGPLVSGIYGGMPDELEMRSAFPRLYTLEEKAGSVIRGALLRKRATSPTASETLTCSGGMEAITMGLTQALGDRVQLATTVEAIEPRDGAWRVAIVEGGRSSTLDAAALIIALPAPQTAKLLEPTCPAASQALSEIPYASLAVVHVGVKNEDLPRSLDGFGFLVPRREDLPILGAIWGSAIFPHRAPSGCQLLTVFLGGRSRPELSELPESALRHKALQGLFRALGGGFSPQLVRARTIRRAIPQYTLGHRSRIELLKEIMAAKRGLALAGNYLNGVSLNDCIRSARAAVDSL